MKFSVIVPVYNIGEYLPECIQSVLEQRYSDFELVLVNDGSTDNSLDICHYYEKLDKRIHVIDKINEGVTIARKTGALASKGEYIVCLDGDDRLTIDTLTELDEIISEAKPDCIYYDMESFGAYSGIIQRNQLDEGLYENSSIETIIKGYLYDAKLPGLNSGNILPSVGGKAIKRDLFIQAINQVPKDIFQAEDLIQNLLILEECSSLYVIHQNYYKYRKRLSSVSNNISTKYLDNAYRVYEYLINNKPIYRNQIIIYTIIRLWNIVAHLYERGISDKEIQNHLITPSLKDISKSSGDLFVGEISVIDRIKIYVVTKRKFILWKVLLRLKYKRNDNKIVSEK